MTTSGKACDAGINAALDRVAPEAGRDLSFFLDLHRCLQRILQHAGEAARFLFPKLSGNAGTATVNGLPDIRRRLNHAIEDDGEAMVDMRLSDLAEGLGAFAIEIESDFPAFVAVTGVGLTDVLARQGRLFSSPAIAPPSASFPRSACGL